MSDPPASSVRMELDQFCRKYQRATTLLLVAAQDYAAARCLLLNNLFAGLVLGAQTIEKLLKAYLLFSDPQRDVKRLSYSLPKLLTEVGTLFPGLGLSGFALLVQKFGSHYATRTQITQTARSQ